MGGPEYSTFADGRECRECYEYEKERMTLKAKVKRLQAELAKLDNHPALLHQGGTSGVDRALRVINKQQTVLKQLSGYADIDVDDPELASTLGEDFDPMDELIEFSKAAADAAGGSDAS